MPFLYQRTIHFKDTDAAGVVYFANVLSMCHEAYEASLQSIGIDLNAFFRDRQRAIPIVHASVDFFQPMFCGDTYSIELTPTLLKPSEFSIAYQIYPYISPKSPNLETTMHNTLEENTSRMEKDLTTGATKGAGQMKWTAGRNTRAKAHSRHVCIHPIERKRLDLDDAMMTWITAYGS